MTMNCAGAKMAVFIKLQIGAIVQRKSNFDLCHAETGPAAYGPDSQL